MLAQRAQQCACKSASLLLTACQRSLRPPPIVPLEHHEVVQRMGCHLDMPMKSVRTTVGILMHECPEWHTQACPLVHDIPSLSGTSGNHGAGVVLATLALAAATAAAAFDFFGLHSGQRATHLPTSSLVSPSVDRFCWRTKW